MKFVLSAGTIRGDRHGLHGDNQDGFTGGEYGGEDGTTIRWTVMLDGCGSGLRSKAGVDIALDFIERKMPQYLETTPVAEIPNQLIMYELVEYIEFISIVAVLGLDEARRFLDGEFELKDHPNWKAVNEHIRSFFLFTVFGLIQTDEDVIVFSRGDGSENVNGACRYFEQNNAPHYPAYFAIPWTVPKGVVSDRNMNQAVYDASSISYVILGTDSWIRHKVLFQALPQFISKNNRWLQRRINVWLQSHIDFALPEEEVYQESVRQAFGDDTTAIALVRIPED